MKSTVIRCRATSSVNHKFIIFNSKRFVRLLIYTLEQLLDTDIMLLSQDWSGWKRFNLCLVYPKSVGYCIIQTPIMDW